MTINVIEYKGKKYPKYQASGFASRFIFPFAKEVCSGIGYDIGCSKKEWSFPGSKPIDIEFDDPWDAYNLPTGEVDYIFSSHCLEHLENWVDALDYWTKTLRIGGVLFLYLPHYDQEYWKPWNNRKHIHIFNPQIIRDYMIDRGYENVFSSKRDLNHSFAIFGERG